MLIEYILGPGAKAVTFIDNIAQWTHLATMYAGPRSN